MPYPAADRLVRITAVGGAAGAVVTVWLLDVLLRLAPGGLPRLPEVHVDVQVLAFTAMTSLFSAFVFGLLPALQSSRADVSAALKEGSRGASSARGVMRSALVIAEFALALVLLVGAALLVRSFWLLQHVDFGFNPHDVLIARLWLPQPNDPQQGRYSNRVTGHAARVTVFEEALRRARSLPGVTGAAVAGTLPFDGTRTLAVVTPEGGTTEDPTPRATTRFTMATPAYFAVMGIPLLRGRAFTDADDATSAPVAIITEGLARRSWPGRDPIGRRIHLGPPQTRNAIWLTVVGVVNDVRSERPEDAPQPTVYRPLRQASNLQASLVLKTALDATTLAAPLAAAVRAADPDQPTYGVRTMDEQVRVVTASRRFSTQLLGAFALLALLLAAVGIYGVMAFVVGQRRREIGIRIALGAHPGSVVALMLRQAMALALGGVVIGVVAALGASRLLAGLLYEVRPSDPATYTFIATLLTGTAALAAWRPARRAAAVDPIAALRAE